MIIFNYNIYAFINIKLYSKVIKKLTVKFFNTLYGLYLPKQKKNNIVECGSFGLPNVFY